MLRGAGLTSKGAWALLKTVAAYLREWGRDLRAAWAFLTILPPRLDAPPAWPRMTRALPIVGAVIGLIQAVALIALLAAGLPVMAAALLGVLSGVVISGAMHEDGLADVADALGGANRERRLEIMRDAASGAFGVLALIFAIGAQTAALSGLAQRGAWTLLTALPVAHLLSRAAMVLVMRRLKPARADGLGHAAGRPPAALTWRILSGAALITIAAFAACCGGPRPALWALAAAGLAAWGMTRLAGRLFGGHTGDVLGATEVGVRGVVLLALAAA
ncbi:MAG TPA: adenosylcobinamide-GDP ribazoletransferase [Thermopetrobacter sp.]|nr:adenosylcobinamide-GDP ribazoletransferase [Thermopetrobacter sp.]